MSFTSIAGQHTRISFPDPLNNSQHVDAFFWYYWLFPCSECYRVDDDLEEEETALVSLLRKETKDTKSSANSTSKVLVTNTKWKEQQNLLQCSSLCWDFKYFTQQQLFLNYTCTYTFSLSYYTYMDNVYVKKPSKKEKPPAWAMALCTMPNAAEK